MADEKILLEYKVRMGVEMNHLDKTDDVDSIDRAPGKDYTHNPKSSDDNWGIILNDRVFEKDKHIRSIYSPLWKQSTNYAQKKKNIEFFKLMKINILN